MTTKISCGGFDIDNDTLIEENGVLKVKGGGGGGGGALVVTLTKTDEITSTDKTAGEIFSACPNVVFEGISSDETIMFALGAYMIKNGIYGVLLRNLASLSSIELYATSADDIMTTQEPGEDQSDSPHV